MVANCEFSFGFLSSLSNPGIPSVVILGIVILNSPQSCCTYAVSGVVVFIMFFEYKLHSGAAGSFPSS
jgi:hypothetical protein